MIDTRGYPRIYSLQSHPSRTRAGNRALGGVSRLPAIDGLRITLGRHARVDDEETRSTGNRTFARDGTKWGFAYFRKEELEKLLHLAERDGVSPAEILRRSFLATA